MHLTDSCSSRDTTRPGITRFLHTSAALAAGLVLWCSGASAAGISARAYGAWLNAPSLGVVDQTICDTGWLPATGGSLSTHTDYTTIPGVFEFYSMAASSRDDDDCEDDDDFSTVDLQEVVLFPGPGTGIVIASITGSDDDDCCNPEDDDFTAANIVGLTVDGQPVTVTGEQNQTVPFSGGTIVLNEYTRNDDDDDCDDDDFTINAVHVYLQNGGQAILGSTHHDDDEDCCTTKSRPSSWGVLKQFYR